jgi:hypothetical protein
MVIYVIHETEVNRPNGHKKSKHLPVQDLSKFTQIGIFGLKNTIWQHCLEGFRRTCACVRRHRGLGLPRKVQAVLNAFGEKQGLVNRP